MKQYDIAAYIWPAYTGKEPRSRIFWEKGIGEWQTVQRGCQKENGYTWNRTPLWGYVDEADPKVMEMQIEAASSHGVNVFIYDWYWYDHRPFLEQCLNDGFLKASNCNKMQFYLMWSNHDANYTWDIRNAHDRTTPVWTADVDRKEFEVIGRRWIEQYFSKENYYKIDGKPVLCIYDLNNFIKGFGGIEAAKNAILWLKKEAKKEGLNGVHMQLIQTEPSVGNVSGVDAGDFIDSCNPEQLGFDSLTHYQYVHFTDVNRNYEEIISDVIEEWEKLGKKYKIPYYPHVSIGWDNNPRFSFFREKIMKNNTPENIEKILRFAKKYADEYHRPLITVNSWNEWTESSYLQPDNINGYGFLEAIKRVFGN